MIGSDVAGFLGIVRQIEQDWTGFVFLVVEVAASWNSLINPWCRGNDFNIVAQGVQMYRSVADIHFSVFTQCLQRMFHPGFIIPVREILAGMCTATFFAIFRTEHGHHGAAE